MNAENKIILRNIETHERQLPGVIQYSIGYPSEAKVLETIKSYHNPTHKILGAFMGDVLAGVIGLFKTDEAITIRHLSVLAQFQRQGIGTLLLNAVKKRYPQHTILLETDEAALGFYLKSGFSCSLSEAKHGNPRYNCLFSLR